MYKYLYNKSDFYSLSKDIWFHAHPYDGNNLVNLMLKVGNSTLDCADLTYQPDPVFIGFTTTQIDNDILVILKVNTDFSDTVTAQTMHLWINQLFFFL